MLGQYNSYVRTELKRETRRFIEERIEKQAEKIKKYEPQI